MQTREGLKRRKLKVVDKEKDKVLEEKEIETGREEKL